MVACYLLELNLPYLFSCQSLIIHTAFQDSIPAQAHAHVSYSTGFSQSYVLLFFSPFFLCVCMCVCMCVRQFHPPPPSLHHHHHHHHHPRSRAQVCNDWTSAATTYWQRQPPHKQGIACFFYCTRRCALKRKPTGKHETVSNYLMVQVSDFTANQSQLLDNRPVDKSSITLQLNSTCPQVTSDYGEGSEDSTPAYYVLPYY